MNCKTEKPHADYPFRLDELQAAGRLRTLRTTEPRAGNHVFLNDRSCLNVASNDYLGLGTDPALRRAFYESLAGDDSFAATGFAASGSRLLGGNHPAYAGFEALLESAYAPEKRALVLNSGYHANIGILPALAERGDLILSDRANHASLLDGIRLSRAQWVRYPHRDLEQLQRLLTTRRATARRVFIVTESIFSMDGDQADLRALVELKQAFDAFLYVDEAHAVGVRGPRGLGLSAECGVLSEVDILVGTLGKALASTGAFVISNAGIHDWLVNTMRSLIFTTALPPVVVNWSQYIFRLALAADDRRARLFANTTGFRQELARRSLAAAGDTHIVPLLVGDDRKTVALAEYLLQHGFLAPPIRPPTVAAGTARLRFSLGAGMTSDEMSALAGQIASFPGGLS